MSRVLDDRQWRDIAIPPHAPFRERHLPESRIFNCDALCRDDDELRKCVVALSPYCVLTSKDADADGSSLPRNARVGLYRILRDGDAMQSRLPYTIATKQISARGLLRFGRHRPLAFSDVNEINWDIVYRRSLVIELRGELLPRSEIREENGSVGNVSAMKDFLGSMSAASVFIRHLLSHIGKYTVGEYTSTTDGHDRGPGGLTWRTMRSV